MVGEAGDLKCLKGSTSSPVPVSRPGFFLFVTHILPPTLWGTCGKAINDVFVQVHASGFVGSELAWPSTWTDRLDRDRTPSIPGHELAGVVTALGYGTRGLSVGQRVFGLTDWHRDGTLAEYVAVEARNLAPLPGDVDFTVGASLPISGLTAWQGLFEHGRLQAGQIEARAA
jgi:NADPH:quinone reductase-like Zn-dependent oxidoreductase